MKKKYDAVVVGAGPSGLLAAKAVGLAGLNVLLLDRKKDLTKLDRLCGQTLISMNSYYFNDLINYNRKAKKLGFLNSGISFTYDGPIRNIKAWYLYSPDGNLISFGAPEETAKKGDDGAVGVSIDKEALFRCLLDEVEEAGVTVCTGINVNDIEPASSGVTVRGSGKTFEGKYLIAADGANSRIARLLGFNKERTFYCYLLTKGWYMKNVDPGETDVVFSSFTHSQEAPGFMFILPRPYQNQNTVAFFTLDPRINLDSVKNYFMKENPFFSKWFSKAEELKEMASSQYIYSPVTVPYKNRVLLAGDTGACQELENSGAMISGWKAGCAIAAALKEDRVGIVSQGISQYIDWWKKVYIEGHSHEAYLMNFALPYVIDKDEDLNYIFGLVKESLPPCWNPYAAVQYIGQLMQGLLPIIQQDRPDLMAKLAAMQQPMTKILKSTTKACIPLAEFD